MIALLLAAGLATNGPADPLRNQKPCAAAMVQTNAGPALLMRPDDWSAARVRKLGELPKARAEYAVMRRVGGCMVPAPTRSNFQPK